MELKKKEALTKFHKDNIIAAAKKLFEEKGVEATRMDDIAREAEYSKSTVYVYFKSKKELVYGILLEQSKYLRDQLDQCVHNYKDFIGCYYEICNLLVAFQRQSPVCYDLMFGQIIEEGESMDKRNVLYDIYVMGEEVNDIIEEYLKKGIEEGVVKEEIEVLPTVFFFWSGISEIIRFASKKEPYFKVRLNMGRQEYMEYSFGLLLQTILK